jgi:putative flippase GtrA
VGIAATLRRVRELPSGQLFRYLVVGGWNTAFGYGVYAALTWALTGRVPHAYMAAAVLANVVAITVAFVGYKLFVFRTRGNWLREYLRCYLVYGATALLGLALLPVLVHVVGRFTTADAAPYVAQAFVIPITVLASFTGHRRFSFRGGAADAR